MMVLFLYGICELFANQILVTIVSSLLQISFSKYVRTKSKKVGYSISFNVFSLGIYEDINLKPTCVQFLPDNEHNVLIGNQGGQVGLYDIRKSKECIVKDSTGNYWIPIFLKYIFLRIWFQYTIVQRYELFCILF